MAATLLFLFVIMIRAERIVPKSHFASVITLYYILPISFTVSLHAFHWFIGSLIWDMLYLSLSTLHAIVTLASFRS